jgi:DNA-binding IclR family transcriptional regulator
VREAEGSRWPRTRAELEEAVAEYERLGCCSSFGHWQPDVNGIAVGIRPTGGGPAMAINVGGPSFKLPSDFLIEKVRPKLIEVAQTIETSLRKD